MKLQKALITILAALVGVAHAGDSDRGGKIYDVTSTPDGLMLRLEGNIVPANCANPNGWGWMIIAEENKTMISLTLSMIAQGKTRVTVYTGGTVSGFCRIVQLDPEVI